MRSTKWAILILTVGMSLSVCAQEPRVRLPGEVVPLIDIAKKLGGSGVGNGGLFLVSQIQYAIRYRLLPLLSNSDNEGLLKQSELEAIRNLILTDGIPIVAVNPVDLPDGVYFSEPEVPAKTRVGRLLSSQGNVVDSRAVLNSERGMNPEIQLHEMAWNQYTWGGHKIPSSLLPHLLHEILRYAYFKKLITWNDDDSIVSSKLNIKDDTPPKDPDYNLLNAENWLNAIPGNIYTGRLLCSRLMPVDKTRMEDGRICQVELAFGNIEPKSRSGNYAIELKDAETNANVLVRSDSYRMDPEGSKVRLVLDLYHSAILDTLRSNDILRFDETTQLFRVDRGAPTVVRKERQDDYHSLMFCEDLDYLHRPDQSFRLEQKGIKHQSERICQVSIEFMTDGKFRIEVKGGSTERRYFGNFIQIGYNLLMKNRDYFAEGRAPTKLETAFYLHLERGKGDTISFGNGQLVFRGGTPSIQNTVIVASGKYRGRTHCNVTTRNGMRVPGECRIDLFLNDPEPGLLRFQIRAIKPVEGDIYESEGFYQQAGTQIQIWRLGMNESLSYFVGNEVLIDELGNELQRSPR